MRGWKLFRYELAVGRPVGRGSRIVVQEALYHFPHRRPRRLLERRSPGTAIFAASDLGFKAGDERLNAIRDDASIMATLAALNVPLAKRMGEWLGNAFAFSDVERSPAGQEETEFAVRAITSNSELENLGQR